MEFSLGIRYDVDPIRSIRYVGSVAVGEIDDVDGFVDAVKATEVQNDVALWNCQQFVLDVLERLNSDRVLSDYEYMEAKNELEGILDE